MENDRQKEILDSMMKQIQLNNIPLSMYEMYVKKVFEFEETKELTMYTSYKIGLANASVLTTSEEERNRFCEIKYAVEDSVAHDVRNNLKKRGIDLGVALTNMKEAVSKNLISINSYGRYTEDIRLASIAKIPGVDILECVNTLRGATVEGLYDYEAGLAYAKHNETLKNIENKVKKRQEIEERLNSSKTR